VQFALSNDGKNYRPAIIIPTHTGIEDTKVQTQTFTAPLNSRGRYIKIIAQQYGPLPVWHDNKGSASYIFADEITVE